MAKRSTKQQLMLSAISLLLCVSMLVGSTFAWFTDSVTSTNNIIKSGTLDVELYYDNSETDAYQKVTTNSNIFLKDALWEPGYTEVVTLKVANEGTLALKYTLGINVAEETFGKNVEGKEFKLSDYIYFGVVEGEKNFADRKAAIEAVKANAMPIRRGFKSELAELVAPGTTGGVSEEYVTVVVYMPETVGNEANYRGTQPVINLGLNLFATQVEYENDSFDNTYDENAAFSVWNGTVPTEMPATLVVDGDTQTVHVKDAAAFAYLSTLSAEWADLYTDGQGTEFPNYANGKGGNYYYSNQWTVSLEADIDLDNKDLAPVNIVFGESTGATAFNGNGHTIRNVKATTGLFANDTRAMFSNLILDNVKATNGALTGSANSSIADVTVKNATISGTDYVGGLVGRAFGNVTGCEVIDSTVIASGKEAGGLIGYIETSSTSSVTNNLVKNVSVYANNRAAGLVAQSNVNVLVYNNHIDTVTVGAENLSTYQAAAVVSNALDAANVYDNVVTNANVATKPVDVVDDSSELSAALAADGDVVLASDVTFTGIAGMPDRGSYVEAYGNKVGFAQYGGVIDGNGNELVDKDGDDSYVIVTHGGTIKNLTITTGARGIVTYSPTENVYLDNIVVDGPGYALNSTEQSSVDMVVTNSTINGWTSLAGFNSVTFEKCKLGENSAKYWQGFGYGQVYDRLFRVYSPTTFTNCEFEQGYYLDMSAGGTATVKNCTVNGVVINAENYADYITIEVPSGKILSDCVTFA